MKIALLGYGKMGRMVEEAALRLSVEVSCRIDPVIGSRGELAGADVCVDFSQPDAVMENIKMAAAANVSMVVGTTGWYDHLDEARRLVEESGIGFVYGSNFSISVNLMFKIARYASDLFSRFPAYDPFIEEAHHKFKMDAPSGTAIFLKRIVESAYSREREETFSPVPTASTRAGFMPGTHLLGFDSQCDTLTITHTARNRAGFAEGAILAAQWIEGRKGFFEFSEIIDEQLGEKR